MAPYTSPINKNNKNNKIYADYPDNMTYITIKQLSRDIFFQHLKK